MFKYIVLPCGSFSGNNRNYPGTANVALATVTIKLNNRNEGVGVVQCVLMCGRCDLVNLLSKTKIENLL